MEVTFRPARPDDLAAIVALLADDVLGSGREHVGAEVDPAYVRAFEAIAADPRQLLVVATRGEEVCGTVQVSCLPTLTHRGGERAQLEGVRVASSARGEGVGRAMVAWVVDEARRRGCRTVQLTTDRRRPDARRFYESLGFEATHDGMKLALPTTVPRAATSPPQGVD